MALDYRERADFFEERIRQEKFSIGLSCILAAAVVASGIFSAILVQFLADEAGSTKTIGTIASCVATLFSGFPLKEYPSLKNKIHAFRAFKWNYEELERHPERAQEMELDKLEDIYWTLKKKVVGA
ncbi:MAG TPA: hypothetical protein VJV05_10495 [Pyrinomonadaceae bacterium]|nr:hypothetical protein [Pyrinomonadaceae bacterium]